MNKDFSIRRFRVGDQHQIRWLHDRTPNAGEVAIRPQRWPEALDHVAANFEAFWVAVEQTPKGEAVIGMLGLTRPGSPAEATPVPDFMAPTETIGRIDYVRVAPERQRRGIGRLLTETAMEWARGHGYERLILETTPQQEAAVALYEALGFREKGRSMFGPYELVWFEFKLRASAEN
jgi:ribosomal protein S18 acetylase RimI-like enzyme